MINLFQKKPKGAEVTLQIEGMHCTSCAMTIDAELEEIKGVTSASTSYASSQTKINFDPNEVDKEELVKAIEGLDYKVTH